MKRFSFTFMAIAAMAFVMGACSGNGNTSASGEESSASGEETNQVTYKNEQFNFSVTLPEGFAQQNDDKQMEAERGGKLFISNGCMIDATGTKINPNFTIEDDYNYIIGVYEDDENSTLISKELAGDHYLVKGKDQFGLRAHYKVRGNDKEVDIQFTYPTDKQAEFDRDVDAVVKSLKID